MNIRIDDDVPLPQPDKADTWQTGPKRCGTCDAVIQPDTMLGTRCDCSPKVDDAWVSAPPVALHVQQYGRAKRPEPKPERYPAETTYDAKGVPTVDCFLVGGPLNGKHGPIVGTAKVVELDIYAADGTVSSVELYELGDKGELGVRHWKGTKP